MSKYTVEDAMKDTNSSKVEVREAWHDARVDAQSVGELNERADTKGVEQVETDSSFHERASESSRSFLDEFFKGWF